MEGEEGSKKEEEKDNIEELEDEDKKENIKSRKKSRPKNKKKAKTSGKTRKKKNEDVESGNSEEGQDKIEEDEVKKEIKGDEDRIGVNYYRGFALKIDIKIRYQILISNLDIKIRYQILISKLF